MLVSKSYLARVACVTLGMVVVGGRPEGVDPLLARVAEVRVQVPDESRAAVHAQEVGWCPPDALLCEHFDDTNFEERGWYDGPRGDVSAETRGPESSGSLRCTYRVGERSCAGGTPGRHLFEPTESLFFEYWVRYAAGFVGSGRP